MKGLLLRIIIEAARWAPSCYNDQPWFFLYANENDDLVKFRSVLVEQNQVWADKAPVLLFLLTNKQFKHTQQPNQWSQFDAGAAWISLALQAKSVGLITHAMAGFDQQKAYQVLNVDPDKYSIVAAIAVGYQEDSSSLSIDLQKMEKPNSRNSVNSFIKQGIM